MLRNIFKLIFISFMLIGNLAVAQSSKDGRYLNGYTDALKAAISLVNSNQAVVAKLVENASTTNEISMCNAVGVYMGMAIIKNSNVFDGNVVKVHATNAAAMMTAHALMQKQGLIPSPDPIFDMHLKILNSQGADVFQNMWPTCDKQIAKIIPYFNKNQYLEFLRRPYNK